MDISFTAWAWPWWTTIVSLNGVNLLLCIWAYRRSLSPRDGSNLIYRRRMRIMGVIFTLVAAYRSVFVSSYYSQMAWFDSLANSSLIIRTLALFAELSFAGLITLGLLQTLKDLPSKNQDTGLFSHFFYRKSPSFLWICIFAAQFFAYGGLITKSNFFFTVEETLWSLGFVAILPLAFRQLKLATEEIRKGRKQDFILVVWLTRIIALWCVIYCSYGLLYHLPFEYWPMAIDEIKAGLPLVKTGFPALRDALLIVNESKEYNDWGFGFLLWHSAYFTVCVWIAIFLMQAPRKRNNKH